jgi:hypothetical protein
MPSYKTNKTTVQTNEEAKNLAYERQIKKFCIIPNKSRGREVIFVQDFPQLQNPKIFKRLEHYKNFKNKVS